MTPATQTPKASVPVSAPRPRYAASRPARCQRESVARGARNGCCHRHALQSARGRAALPARCLPPPGEAVRTFGYQVLSAHAPDRGRRGRLAARRLRLGRARGGRGRRSRGRAAPVPAGRLGLRRGRRPALGRRQLGRAAADRRSPVRGLPRRRARRGVPRQPAGSGRGGRPGGRPEVLRGHRAGARRAPGDRRDVGRRRADPRVSHAGGRSAQARRGGGGGGAAAARGPRGHCGVRRVARDRRHQDGGAHGQRRRAACGLRSRRAGCGLPGCAARGGRPRRRHGRPAAARHRRPRLGARAARRRRRRLRARSRRGAVPAGVAPREPGDRRLGRRVRGEGAARHRRRGAGRGRPAGRAGRRAGAAVGGRGDGRRREPRPELHDRVRRQGRPRAVRRLALRAARSSGPRRSWGSRSRTRCCGSSTARA